MYKFTKKSINNDMKIAISGHFPSKSVQMCDCTFHAQERTTRTHISLCARFAPSSTNFPNSCFKHWYSDCLFSKFILLVSFHNTESKQNLHMYIHFWRSNVLWTNLADAHSPFLSIIDWM